MRSYVTCIKEFPYRCWFLEIKEADLKALKDAVGADRDRMDRQRRQF